MHGLPDDGQQRDWSPPGTILYNVCLPDTLQSSDSAQHSYKTCTSQPVAEVFRELREKKPRTLAPLILHTDAAQVEGAGQCTECFVQCSTVQCSAVQCSAVLVQCSAVQCSAVQCSLSAVYP